MPSGSTTVHEANLSPATHDMHRAIVSLMEELEAVDWYQQRMEGAEDGELREILRHNRDEEKEHAAMVLEWIRRRDPAFDEKLREYLFTDGSIVHREQTLEPRAPTSQKNGAPRTLDPATLGSMRNSGSQMGSLRGQR